MKLSDTQFETLENIIDTSGLSRWVIVKEYIPLPTNVSHIRQIHAKFEIAKKARILPQDVRVENYRGTKIVDLSSALTEPCPEWSKFSFEFFYQETVHGVFAWFPNQPPRVVSSSLLLTGTFIAVLSGWLLLRRVR